jgi:hypothetical protein
VEKRLYTRFKVDLPVSFTGDATGTGTVYNLGIGGCKVLSRNGVAQGAILTVHLRVPGASSAITIRAATVRWVMGQDFGLEFLGMQESERERLAEYLRTVR